MKTYAWIATLAVAALSFGLAAACGDDPAGPSGPHPPDDPSPSDPYAVLIGTGDISDCISDDDEATASILDYFEGIVFTTGDNVYPNGTAKEFAECYDPTWGRHKDRTRPTPGNHDYNTKGAVPYFEYFGEAAGKPGKGWYSYTAGEWHIIALNSNIDMGEGSEQLEWLKKELKANDAKCTLAYWHHPLFTSSVRGRITEVVPLWEALEEAGADLILNGHDHHYERFAPQTSAGKRDNANGIRQFIVGTGGRSLRKQLVGAANSEFRYTGSYGVLRLKLYAEHYAWEFITTGGKVIDEGIGFCR